MSEWSDVTSRRERRCAKKSQGWRAQSGLRAPEWQCCKTPSFLTRDTCRGCGKQRDVIQDEYINERSQTAAWPQQSGNPSGEVAHSALGREERARFRRAIESGQKTMQALQKAQENFEQAQREVMQARTALEMQHAGSPRCQ